MRRLAKLTAVLLLTCAPLSVRAHNADAVVVEPGMGAVLDGYLSRFAAFGFSYSILIAEGDRVVLRKAYGPDITTRSVFDTASLAKQFTATALIRLAEQGQLSLSDPVARFFPEAPPPLANVTVDQLLSHTAGVHDDYGLYEREPILGQAEFRGRILGRALANVPGSRWEYANDGYTLLAMIIEQVSGRPFQDYMREELFAAAGLDSTGFYGDARLLDRLATARGGRISPRKPEQTWVGLGAGDVLSSPSDLFRWEKALDGGHILTPQGLETLRRPILEVVPPILSYGRGWWNRTVELNGVQELNIFHSGREDDGWSAWYSRFPERKLVIIFATHQGWHGSPLREALFSATTPSNLERLIFGGNVRMPPATRDDVPLAQFAGRYELDRANWIQVVPSNRRLVLQPHGQLAFNALLPARSSDVVTEALHKATESTSTILAQLVRGNDAPYRTAVGDRDDGSDLPPPAVQSYEVSGSYPSGLVTETRGRIVTHANIRHTDGREAHIHFVWSGTTLVDIWAADTACIPEFAATGERAFANFHPFLQEPAYVVFNDSDLRVTTVATKHIAFVREGHQ